MTIHQLKEQTYTLLSTLYNRAESNAVFNSLLQSVDIPSYYQVTEPRYEIGDEGSQRLLSMAEQLATGAPLQYVLGVADFYDIPLKVDGRVLIPRPETEELVRMVVNDFHHAAEPLRVLDICTGSGCIAIALKKNLLHGSSVYGCDISDDALALARENALSVGCDVKFFNANALSNRFVANVWDACGSKKENGEVMAEGMFDKVKFNIIISNPPYVREAERALMKPNVLDFEPPLALFVPDTEPLLFYNAIADGAKGLLVSGGVLYFEINEAFGAEIKSLLQEKGYSSISVIKDLFGKERFAKAVL